MKLGKLIAASATAAALSLAAMPASAYVVLDGWQIYSGLTAGDTGIGHLNLGSGVATVEQELAVVGMVDDQPILAPVAGTRFFEFGAIYSVTYTRENLVGTGDTGPLALLGTAPEYLNLQFEFIGLEGTVTAYDPVTGEIDYAFDPGAGYIMMRGAVQDEEGDLTTGYFDLAKLELMFGGGDLADFFGIAQTNGESTIVAAVTEIYVAGLFRDSGGTALDDLVPGDLIFEVVTTNQISNPATFSGACSFNQEALCSIIQVTSEGSADALRIPEPGSIALLGLGLVGLGVFQRRRAQGSAALPA